MYLAVWLKKEYESRFKRIAEERGKKPGQLAREIVEDWLRSVEE